MTHSRSIGWIARTTADQITDTRSQHINRTDHINRIQHIDRTGYGYQVVMMMDKVDGPISGRTATHIRAIPSDGGVTP